ncbi:MAG: TrkH family potassium uptake protein [Candidatus Bathyarchaeia archaeon]|jgi:trk system potassium uptake protein TrkH
MRALLANMGFVLQISGIFILIPIVVSFIYNETQATIALFLTATAFLALGFALNTLCEKKELSYKQSCTLVVLVFVILSLIGSIPYFYVDTNVNILQRITDSIFESTSGFTTTGFSVIPDVSLLPKSIILYRGLTQFIGGVGIVLVLIAFFYPETKLHEFARSMGLTKNGKVKKAITLIITVYCGLTIALISAGLIFGYHDIINLASIVFAALGTGGFSPVPDITPIATQPPMNAIILVSIVLGATNFLALAGLFKGKIKAFFNSEISVFLALAAVSIVGVVVFFDFSVFDATFHVLSAMSCTGFAVLSVPAFPDSLKLFFVFLMLVGGASFSTAGGIKIFRFVLLLKATKKAIVDTVTENDEQKIKLFGRSYTNIEVMHAAMLVLLAIAIIFVSSLVVCHYGYRPIDAIFETTSALATAGLSAGIVSFSLATELKWLFIFLMLLGRVEIMAFLIMFFREKNGNVNGKDTVQCKRSRHRKKNGTTKSKPKEEPAPEPPPTPQAPEDNEEAEDQTAELELQALSDADAQLP